MLDPLPTFLCRRSRSETNDALATVGGEPATVRADGVCRRVRWRRVFISATRTRSFIPQPPQR